MSLRADLTRLTKRATAEWTKAKRKAERAGRAPVIRCRSNRATIREVAFAVMESAYLKASANGKYYANARQIMYAARPEILARADADELSDVYFTQTLLKDYIEQFTPDWKVVWDARGNLIEPHTGMRVPLGGAKVTQYLDAWHVDAGLEVPSIAAQVETLGPRARFSNVLFIEKEGFTEILTDAGIPERYDMALMSTKGIPVDAACDLITGLHEEGVRVFVLHDFDLAGFKIRRTLQRGTRLSTGTAVIDLGLRLDDTEGLPAEPTTYRQQTSPEGYLRKCGATDAEIKFLVSGNGYHGYTGRRVEINAMTSGQLIAWLDAKFAAHDVRKTVPDEDTLHAAYRRAQFAQRLEERMDDIREELEDDKTNFPDDLEQRVRALLGKFPRMSWDEAVWGIAKDEKGNEP